MLCIYCMVKSYCSSCCPCCNQNSNDMSVKVRLAEEEQPWRPESPTNQMSREQIDLIREAEFGRGMQAGLRSLNASLENLNHFNSRDLLSDTSDPIDARLNKSKAKSMTHLAHQSITKHTYENDDLQIPPPLPPRKYPNKFHTLRWYWCTHLYSRIQGTLSILKFANRYENTIEKIYFNKNPVGKDCT